MSDKTFVGKAEVKTTQYGKILKLGLTAENLETLGRFLNNKGWVNINIMTSKNGNLYAVIDDYGLKKERKQQYNQEMSEHNQTKSNGYQPQFTTPEPEAQEDEDHIPF